MRKAISTTGKTLAIVFHPVFLFFYFITGLVFFDNSLQEHRIQVIGISFLVTVFIPTGFTFIMQKNLLLYDKKQRPIPLLFGAFCYLLAAWLLINYDLPGFVFHLLIAIAISSVAIGLISIKWKISMHANGMGCMAGLLIYFMPDNALNYRLTAIVILIMGIVLSQRILSKSHTLAEVGAGFFLGISITVGVLMFF